MNFPVQDYCSKLGWFLVSIPPGTKGPTKFGWQKPERALSDPEQARLYYEENPNHNSCSQLHKLLAEKIVAS